MESCGIESPRSPPKSPMRTREYEKMLNAASINDIIEEIYSKNSEIMQEFQSYLEKSVEAEPVINIDAEKEFLKVKGMTDNEFVRTPEPIKLPEVEDEVEDNQSYSDSFESSDTEQETITKMNKMANKLPKFNTRRRESIEDVNGWFNNHLDIEEKESELCGSMDAVQHNPSTYNMQKIFPFGKTITGRRDSMSDEFFDKPVLSMTKSDIGTLRESESSMSEDGEKEAEPEVVKSKEVGSRSPDHSTLLKFLDQEKQKM